MTERFEQFKKYIIKRCAEYEFKDVSDLILLQDELIRIYEDVEDSYMFNDTEFSSDEYRVLKYSLRELVTTISWALYHNNYYELYVSKTFLDLINDNIKRIKEGGE